jgi:hypothetical protein
MDDVVSREEIASRARDAGLDLPDAYLDELVSAYAHVRAMLQRLPRNRSYGDEPAHVFVPARLAPEPG